MKSRLIVVVAALLLIPQGAFAAKLLDLNGQTYRTHRILSHQKVVLMLWATWCPSCRRDLSRLDFDSWLDKDITIYFVSFDEDEKIVEKFANDARLSKFVRDRILIDKEGVLAEQYAIIGVPTYLFFEDKQPVYRSFYINPPLVDKVFNAD